MVEATHRGPRRRGGEAVRRLYHLLMIWPCLWIGMLYKDENWFSEQATIHWMLSRRFFKGGA